MSRQSEARESPEAGLSMVCAICKHIFAHSKDGERASFWYYDIFGLFDSVKKGCHFCTQVLREMRIEDVEFLKGEIVKQNDDQSELASTDRRLSVETRYYEGLGIAFLVLRNGERLSGCLGTLYLYFMRDLDGPNFSNINTLSTIQGWIKQCTSEHTTCKSSVEGSLRDQWPCRILSIGEHGKSPVRLCETSTFTMLRLRYATLSHCWGDLIPLRLLKENIFALRKEVPLTNLPKTFLEAVETTKNLGLSYLWIDSLCIIQDSPEDWASESNRMREIFRNSSINLAAAASSNATGGLLHSTSLLARIPCTVVVGMGESEERAATRYISGIQRNSQDLPLFHRAWVFQEVLLPARSLIFTKQEVCWECKEMSRTETYPNQESRPNDIEGNLSIARLFSLRNSWRNVTEESVPSRLALWRSVICHYSDKVMSKSSDKLVALGGLAHDLGQTWPELEYFAGLWSQDLLHSLLWRCHRCTKSRFYNAPSWSWASVDGEVNTSQHDSAFCDAVAEVVEACTLPAGPSINYGAVTDGFIRIKGPLIQARISSHKKPGGYVLRLLEEALREECQNFIRIKFGIRVEWDDQGFGDICEAGKVFLMPLHILSKRTPRPLSMEGLVLSPNYRPEGQFRRIGWFEVNDRLSPFGFDESDGESDDKIDLFSEHDSVKMGGLVEHDPGEESNRAALRGSLSYQDEIASFGGSPEAPELTDAVDMLFTAFDVAVFRKQYLEIDNSSELPEIQALSKKRAVAPSKGHAERYDKFNNTVIDSTLRDRYAGQIHQDYYWNINSFLTFANLHWFSHVRKDERSWKMFYEESHDEGIYKIRIV